MPRRVLLRLQKARDSDYFADEGQIKQLTGDQAYESLLMRDDFKKFLAKIEQPPQLK